MSVYKPPHYITLGVYVMAKTPDDKIVGVPIALEEVGEEGIGAEIEKVINNLVASGLTTLTQEEHDALAREWIALEQAKHLSVAMNEQVKYNAIDPERMNKIMTGHKGRPGGDA